MNNRTSEAEVRRLQKEIRKIREQNDKLNHNHFHHKSPSFVYHNPNHRSQILNKKNSQREVVAFYLSQQLSKAQMINYTSRGEPAFANKGARTQRKSSEYIKPPTKQGSFSYRKCLDGNNWNTQRKKQLNNLNLSLLSHDLKLASIDGSDDNDDDYNYNDSNTGGGALLKKDSTGSLDLNKYIIKSMRNIPNRTPSMTELNNNQYQKQNQYKQSTIDQNALILNQLMDNYNGNAKRKQQQEQGTSINNVLSQFKIGENGIYNNNNHNNYSNGHDNSNSPINSTKEQKYNYINNPPRMKSQSNHINGQINSYGSLTHLISSMGSQASPGSQSIIIKEPDTKLSYFKTKPKHQRESRRMILEYIKIFKKPNENIHNLLSTGGINLKVLDQQNNEQKQQTSQAMIIGENYKPHQLNRNNSLDNAMINGLGLFTNNSNSNNIDNKNMSDYQSLIEKKINLINFLSIPRILNLIVNDETLVPCVFIVTPSELTITDGIEVYLFKYKELENNSFNHIEGCFDLSKMVSCTSSSISSLRFILSFSKGNNVDRYEIETPSIELRTDYLKGLNYILSMKTITHKRMGAFG